MQTVNFQCGNCNKLMAVSAEHVGRQVRCPHCQAVVVAPTTVPAPAPAAAESPLPETVSFQPPRLGEQDDIFAPPEPTDDLFGRPDAPRVEMPAPAPLTDAPTIDENANALPPAPEPFAPTMTWHGSPPAPAPANDATLPSWMDHAPDGVASAPAPAPAAGEEAHEEAYTPSVRKPRDGGGWFIGLVFIPLISYSVLATVAVIVLWYRLQQAPPPPPNPLETLPSFDPNDADHSTHLKLDQRNQMPVFRNMDVKTATLSLPDNLVVRMGKGQKLQVGDLEIEPLKVSLEKVAVDVQGYDKPEPCQYPSLVLFLKLRNISKDVAFQPMDVYFDRKWKGKGEPPPLTLLELQGENHPTRFFGGPAEFHMAPLTARSNTDPPQSVHGDHCTTVLNPGESMETFVATDGQDKAASEAINRYRGKLQWRVHLRRGIVKLDEHRYVPVSSVVGVDFTDDDYR